MSGDQEGAKGGWGLQVGTAQRTCPEGMLEDRGRRPQGSGMQPQKFPLGRTPLSWGAGLSIRATGGGNPASYGGGESQGKK